MPDLYSRRRLLRRFLTVAAIGSTPASRLLATECAVEREKIRVDRIQIELPHLPASLDGFRIAQLSDLHLEPFTTEEDIQFSVNMCNALKPDLITLTGDFVTHTAKPVGRLAEILAQLQAPYGVLGCLGNHDFVSGAPQVIKALAERHIPILRNETRAIHTDHGVLNLAGFDSAYVSTPNLRKTLAEHSSTEPLVIMMHEPDVADYIATSGIQALQISGHTHGGQLRFRGKDPAAMRRAKFGKKYLAGHYQIGSLQLYVNRGIGCVGVPMRVGCPPEVTEITLRSPAVLHRVS